MSAPESHAVEAELDEQVLGILLASRRRFLSFVERRVESRDVAEDILQAGFARAVERQTELQSSSDSTVAWFFRLLRNAVVDHYRRRAVRERTVESFANFDTNIELDEELQHEICACFEDLLPTLKSEYATVIRAVDLGGRAVADVAHELGITANNAGVRLHRAREALRRRLQQSCSLCAEHGCLDCTCGRSPT